MKCWMVSDNFFSIQEATVTGLCLVARKFMYKLRQHFNAWKGKANVGLFSVAVIPGILEKQMDLKMIHLTFYLCKWHKLAII